MMRNISWCEAASPQGKLLFSKCLLFQGDFDCLLGEGNKQKLKQHRKTTNPPSPLPHKPQPPCLSRCLIWTIFPLISKKLYGQTGTLHLVLPNSITFTCVFSWNYLGKAYMLYIWVQWNAFPKTPEIGWIVS